MPCGAIRGALEDLIQSLAELGNRAIDILKLVQSEQAQAKGLEIFWLMVGQLSR